MATATANGTLYYGPSTATYPSDGTYSGTVTVLWKEGSWYYVEANTSPKRRGYISALTNIVGAVDSFMSTLLTRYTLSTTPSNEPTYQGPATNYKQAGSLGPNETVKFLSDNGSNTLTKIGDYAIIEYDITGSTQKKRGWFPHMKLTTTMPSIEVGTRPVGTSFKTDDYPNYPSGNYHGGTDIGSSQGANANDAIKASFGGKVVGLVNDVPPGTGTSYGNYVVIESTINGVKYRTWYAHMNSVSSAVTLGGNITKGQTIGYVGNTGNCIPRSYYHLHLEYRKDPYGWQSNNVDPKTFY